ncbi:MAG TPA: hypothetical protein VLC74_12015 [Rhizomicrobium sp.]|nr:hypothetical protein [Rhizomicrobium sp.]
MSVELRNVEIRIRGKLQPLDFKNINFRIEPQQRVALLCPDRVGLSSLVAVIAGIRRPDTGRVIREGRLSWPIPDASFCHKHLNFVGNARFIARLYGMNQKTFIPQVIETAGIQDLAEERLDRCPKTVLSRFAFALGVCVPFDIYFFTATSAGEKSEQEKYQQIVAELGRTHGIMVAATKAKAAELHCDEAFLIDGRTTHYYDDMEAAADHMARLAKRSRPDDDDEVAEEEEQAFDDF